MTDYKEMIERFRSFADRWEHGEQLLLNGELRLQDALRDAATAIETLMAERDAAVEGLAKRPHPSTCKYGEHCDYISAITRRPDCYSCDEWQWRGPQDEED